MEPRLDAQAFCRHPARDSAAEVRLPPEAAAAEVVHARPPEDPVMVPRRRLERSAAEEHDAEDALFDDTSLGKTLRAVKSVVPRRPGAARHEDEEHGREQRKRRATLHAAV